MRVFVTGATGHVGSALIPALVSAGHQVYAGARDPEGAQTEPWSDDVSVREFDVESTELVESALEGIEAVFYLVHSLTDDDFVEKDREAAERVAAACVTHGVTRIVYLSGLVPQGDLSDHLRSRLEVEEVFTDSAVPTIVLRAAMVIGAGSTSFEILRRLTERLPIEPVPAWMRRRLQPIAIDDVVHLLVGSLSGPEGDHVYDVGGDQVITYPDLLRLFATIMGVRRLQVVLPWVPAWLVGRLVALISGMDRPTVTSLVESLSHDMVVTEDRVRREIADPHYRFTSLEQSLREAMTA